MWYEGTGLSDRRWLVADERGSVIAVTDASGNAMDIKSYDEFGAMHDPTAPSPVQTNQRWPVLPRSRSVPPTGSPRRW